ncbi:MAG TPA: VOC family protein [Casimicrobiaceae bacterium]|nr:VOC family protein [Casimicrobiaceae bacterium]
MIDHIGIPMSNVDRSSAFYDKALAPLGIVRIIDAGGWIGMGRRGKPDFWFGENGIAGAPASLHIAFTAENREQVRAFHNAAIAAGGRDNGAPGIRAVYHPNYYGAFVFDPDGHNVEAVCHAPE